MGIKLLVDSGCDLSQELAKKYNVGILPFTAICNEVEYKDGIDITSKELNERMREGDVFTTAQIPIDEYYKAFLKETEKGNKVILLVLSSGITSSINSARLAKNMLLDENPNAVIEVIDSKLASYGFGLLVRRTAEYIQNGMDFDDVVLKINELIDSTLTYFTVDDLKYLYRGGRVSAAEKVVGGMLNIKPVLHVDKEGRLIPIDKARGIKKVYKKFVELTKKEMDPDINKDQLIIVGHSDSLQSALDFKEILANEMGFTNIYIDEIGPVISSHSGPGTLMFTLLKKNLEEEYMNIKM